MEFDLNLFKEEYDELLKEISDPGLISDWEKFEELSKRKKKLENLIQKADELKKTIREKEENKTIISKEDDPELISLAEGEIEIIKEKIIILEKEVKELFEKINSDGDDGKKSGAVIVEIRAGAGGNEAALFAENLFKMYSRYAQNKGWTQKILSSSTTEVGGLKEVIFELKNGNVYSSMQYEGGVHRVQRVPETEKGGRIHTSTVSVIAMLKPKKGTVKILPNDLKVDTYKASGPGGQNVNKRETAIRITHLPTGTVVTSQTERSLAQNKENAMSILEARIMEKLEKERVAKLKKERASQVTSSDRSEKIRTYNFPQNRITDHRIQKSWHNIEIILNGEIDPIVKALQEEGEK